MQLAEDVDDALLDAFVFLLKAGQDAGDESDDHGQDLAVDQEVVFDDLQVFRLDLDRAVLEEREETDTEDRQVVQKVFAGPQVLEQPRVDLQCDLVGSVRQRRVEALGQPLGEGELLGDAVGGVVFEQLEGLGQRQLPFEASCRNRASL